MPVSRSQEKPAAPVTRLFGEPRPQLLPHLVRPHEAFLFAAGPRRRWIEPAQLPVTLIIDLDERLTAGGRRLPPAWVAGPSDSPEEVELGGRHTTVDVKLTPLGSLRLLGIPPREIAGRVVGLEELLGGAGRRLTEAVADAGDWPTRFSLVDEFLAGRPRSGKLPSPVVEEAWRRLCRAGGNLSIRELAEGLQISRRHLSSLFAEQVGLPPKTVARLLRFTRAHRQMQSRPQAWAEVAFDCGYFDQAHLNRDFRQFAGTTPTGFLARQL